MYLYLDKSDNNHTLDFHAFRCINGSTLIHTAAYFGVIPVLKVLLKERVDVNLRDYKGATPLHRAKDKPTIRVQCCLSIYVLLKS